MPVGRSRVPRPEGSDDRPVVVSSQDHYTNREADGYRKWSYSDGTEACKRETCEGLLMSRHYQQREILGGTMEIEALAQIYSVPETSCRAEIVCGSCFALVRILSAGFGLPH